MEGDLIVNQLLDSQHGNPFYNSSLDSIADKDRAPKKKHLAPRFVRAMLYEYRYSSLSMDERQRAKEEGWEVGRIWQRRVVGEYLPALEANNRSVKQFLKAFQMIK